MILKRETFDRILKMYGAKRVSPEASELLAKIVEEKISVLIREAWSYAKHAKRNTLFAEDVILARKKLNI